MKTEPKGFWGRLPVANGPPKTKPKLRLEFAFEIQLEAAAGVRMGRTQKIMGRDDHEGCRNWCWREDAWCGWCCCKTWRECIAPGRQNIWKACHESSARANCPSGSLAILSGGSGQRRDWGARDSRVRGAR